MNKTPVIKAEVTYYTPAYFNAKAYMWEGPNGEDACQDHAVLIPCPFQHGRSAR